MLNFLKTYFSFWRRKTPCIYIILHTLSMERHNKFESYPEVVQPSTRLSTCIFTWLSEQGSLMPIRKFSQYNPLASLSSSCSLVTIVLCSAGSFLSRCKEGRISFWWPIRKSRYCLQSGHKGKIFVLLRGNGFLALCSVSFKTDITFFVLFSFVCEFCEFLFSPV